MAAVASMMQEDPNTSSLAKYYSSKIVELREVRSVMLMMKLFVMVVVFPYGGMLLQ